MAEQNLKMVFGAEDDASKVIKGIDGNVRGLSTALKQHFSDAKDASDDFALGVAAVAAATGALTVNAVKTAGEFQVFEKQMKVLLGSTEAAKDRMEELKEFGATTPFELPGVVRASIVLETLTKGALSTGEGLRVVGDIAAGTKQPFEDIAVHIGRIYDAMQSGRPFGESAMRLQELGAISGDTRGKLEEMTEGGADFADMWGLLNVDLGKFSGMMEEMNDTIPGQWSNLMDSVENSLASFGEKLDETFQIKDKISIAANAIGDFGNNLDSVIGIMEENKDLIVGLSGAIAGALVPAVIGAAISIGAMVATLAPWAVAGAVIFSNWEKVKDLFIALSPVIVAAGSAFVYFKAKAMITATIAGLTGGIVGLTGALAALKVGLVIARVAITGFLASIGPIGWAIIALGTVVTAFTAAWHKDWGGIREKTEYVVNKVIDALNWMLKGVEWAGKKLGMDWDLTMNHVSFTTKEMVNSVSGSVSTLVSNVQNAFSFTGQLLSGNGDAWSAVGDKVTKVAAKIGIDVNKIKKSVSSMKTSGTKDFSSFGGSASSAAGKVEDLEEAVVSLEQKSANKLVRVNSKYEELRTKLEKVAESHRNSVASIVEDLSEVEKAISDLSDPESSRNEDFRKQAAEQVLEIERQLKEERDDLTKDEIKDLESALEQNKSFIQSIESEITEARKIARMDELTRAIYLFNQETEALRVEYTQQKIDLEAKLEAENALYAASASKISKTMRVLLHAQIRLRGDIEGVTKESLENEHEMLDDALDGYLGLIDESADSAELKHFMSQMDLVVSKANAAIAAAKKASSISSSISISSGGRAYAMGGIASGFPSGVYDSPVWNPRGDVAGEAGPEAIVPLPDGRSIPVEVRGGGGSASGGGVTIQNNFNGGVFADGVRQFSQKLMAEVTKELSMRGVKIS